jgi:hypothetical protein
VPSAKRELFSRLVSAAAPMPNPDCLKKCLRVDACSKSAEIPGTSLMGNHSLMIVSSILIVVRHPAIPAVRSLSKRATLTTSFLAVMTSLSKENNKFS